VQQVECINSQDERVGFRVSRMHSVAVSVRVTLLYADNSKSARVRACVCEAREGGVAYVCSIVHISVTKCMYISASMGK
jgi:hypothetical protein